jgi:nucleotide-binding universal stress UspA family protein
VIFERLLVAVDFSPCSEAAVRFSLDLAPRVGAAIEFLYVDVWRAPDEHGVPPPEALPAGVPTGKDIEESLARLTKRAEEAGASATSHCVRSLGVAPAIVAHADAVDADGIVMSTHGYQGVRRFILGSNTEEVLRSSTRSLLIVPEAYERSSPGRILVPVDLSGSTEEQLERATNLAVMLGLEMSVIYVIQPLPLIGGLTGFGTMGDLAPSLDEQVKREVGRLARRASKVLGREVKSVIRRGSAAREIVLEADESRASLIVMARHGLSAVDRFFLGSVTERVARTTVSPLLVLTTKNEL